MDSWGKVDTKENIDDQIYQYLVTFYKNPRKIDG